MMGVRLRTFDSIGRDLGRPSFWGRLVTAVFLGWVGGGLAAAFAFAVCLSAGMTDSGLVTFLSAFALGIALFMSLEGVMWTLPLVVLYAVLLRSEWVYPVSAMALAGLAVVEHRIPGEFLSKGAFLPLMAMVDAAAYGLIIWSFFRPGRTGQAVTGSHPKGETSRSAGQTAQS